MFIKNLFKKKIDKKLISVVFWPDRILINHYLRTKAGFWLGVQPYILLNIESTNFQIGSEIIKFIEYPSYIISTPKLKDYKKLNIPRYKTAKVKSEKEFMINSKNVSLSIKNNEMVFKPTRNCGYKGDNKGFKSLEEYSIKINLTNDPDEIGKTLNDGKR